MNKVDLVGGKERKIPEGYVKVSAEKDVGLGVLRKKMWDSLGFTRVYLVKPDSEPSKEEPIIMKKKDVLVDVAEKIGTEFSEGKKKAKIWGKGAKFPGQEVSLTTVVKDGMMIRFV